MQGTSKPDQQFLDAAVLCEHLLGKGSVAAFLAENRKDLFPDEMFEDLFPSGRGRPSVPADVIATIMVLQSPLALVAGQDVEPGNRPGTWPASPSRSMPAAGLSSPRAARTVRSATAAPVRRTGA